MFDENAWVAIAAVGALVGALVPAVGLLVAQRRHKKEDQRKQREEMAQMVDAQVNSRMMEQFLTIRNIETKLNEELGQLQRTVQTEAASLLGDINSKEQTVNELLESSQEHAHEIAKLLNTANLVMPQLEQIAPQPDRLLFLARGSDDPAQSSLYLGKILENDDADSKILEYSGDHARKIGDEKLALRLYERSLEVDPENVTCMSEYLALRIKSPDGRRDEARDLLIELALNNADISTILIKLFNSLYYLDDYDLAIETGKALLPITSKKSMVWRNIGTALSHLDYPQSEIEEAFQQAFELGSPSDYANAAIPYVGILIDIKEYDTALEILDKALRAEPMYAVLHLHQGTILEAKGDLAGAAKAYQLFKRFGSFQQKSHADHLLNRLAVLQELGLVDANTEAILSPTSSMVATEPENFARPSPERLREIIESPSADYAEASEFPPSVEPGDHHR